MRDSARRRSRTSARPASATARPLRRPRLGWPRLGWARRLARPLGGPAGRALHRRRAGRRRQEPPAAPHARNGHRCRRRRVGSRRLGPVGGLVGRVRRGWRHQAAPSSSSRRFRPRRLRVRRLIRALRSPSLLRICAARRCGSGSGRRPRWRSSSSPPCSGAVRTRRPPRAPPQLRPTSPRGRRPEPSPRRGPPQAGRCPRASSRAAASSSAPRSGCGRSTPRRGRRRGTTRAPTPGCAGSPPPTAWRWPCSGPRTGATRRWRSMPARASAPGPAASTSARTPPSTPPTRSSWPALPPGW